MPEGPEVTIVAEGLNEILQGKYITNFEVTDNGRYRNKAPDNSVSFGDSLPLLVEKVENKGKLIYFTFSSKKDKFYMINTLGMSGVWKKRKEKHTCFLFEYSSSLCDEDKKIEKEEEGGNKRDEKKEKIYFVDQRHFGTIKFLTSKEDLEKKLKEIGPDMLNDPKMSYKLFKERMMKYKHWNLVKALMCQKIISGIGNYLKSESLYHAKISPFLKVEDLSEQQFYNLYQAIRLKIVSSYNDGGVSVKNFVDVDDKKGQYHFTFEVYGRKEDKLGNKIERIVLDDKRSTFYVPSLQS
jgi:DNA-formamidopyrimidine glycosylase